MGPAQRGRKSGMTQTEAVFSIICDPVRRTGADTTSPVRSQQNSTRKSTQSKGTSGTSLTSTALASNP